MIGKVRKFVTEVKVEMSKVTWSTRQELVNSTIIVLVTIAFLSVYIGLIDLVLSQTLNFILR